MSYSRPTVHAYLPNFVSIGLFCRPVAAKNPNFCRFFAVFWTSAFSDVANWHQFPLSNGIKIVSVLQRLHGEIGRTVSDVQKRDEQTGKKLNVLATSAVGETRACLLYTSDAADE